MYGYDIVQQANILHMAIDTQIQHIYSPASSVVASTFGPSRVSVIKRFAVGWLQHAARHPHSAAAAVSGPSHPPSPRPPQNGPWKPPYRRTAATYSPSTSAAKAGSRLRLIGATCPQTSVRARLGRITAS